MSVHRLEEMQRQFAAMNRDFTPTSPLSSPKRTKSGHNLSSKEGVAINPDVLTLSLNQNSQISNNVVDDGDQATKSSSSTTPRKKQLCHQQFEGFEVPVEEPHNTSNLNLKDSRNFALNNTASCSTNCINLNVERVGDGGLNLTFNVLSSARFKIDLDNWRVSCYLGNKQKSPTCVENISLPSQIDLINAQEDDNGQPNDDTPSRKIHKVVIESPSSGIANPIMNEFSSDDFVSIERSNQPCTVNQDDLMITNNSDKHAFRNELSISSQINENNCHVLLHDVGSKNQSFKNSVKNYKSSSSKSPSPLKKKKQITLMQEESLLGNEEVSSYTSENTKTKNSVHINQIEAQLKYNSDQKASSSHYVSDVVGQVYDSTGDPEIAPSSKSQEFNSKKNILKERRQKDQSSSNEMMSIISMHNERNICRNKAIASTSNFSDIYVRELDTKNHIVCANEKTISDIDGEKRDSNYFKRSKASSKRPSKTLKKCHDSKIQNSSNLANVKDLLVESGAETIVNKHNSVQILNGRIAPNILNIGSKNVECNIADKTLEIESVVANNHNFKFPDEELHQEIGKSKEFVLPFKKSETLPKKFKNKTICKVSSKNTKAVQSSRSKKDKSKNPNGMKKKHGKYKVMKKTSIKKHASEFVTTGVNIETEENEIVSSGNPTPASFSVSISVTDNLEEGSVIDAPDKGILDQKFSTDRQLPSIEIRNSSNCFSQDSVNINAKIPIKTENETFPKNSCFNTFIKNEQEVNVKKSERTSVACKELHVNEQVLYSNELDSTKFNIPCDKIIKQEIEANFSDENSFAKTNEMTSQNTVFPNESNSFLSKSNNLKDSQFSVRETNEFMCPGINNSSIKIKSSPHSSPLQNNLFESDDVDISVMDVHPFYTDAKYRFIKAKNVQVNEEFSSDENALYSQKSDNIVNFSVVDNDELNKLASLETEITDDQDMENIKADFFALFGTDGISTNLLLVSPLKEKDQYSNSKEKNLVTKEEPSDNKRRQEDSSVEIAEEQSLSSSSCQSVFVKKESNAIENSQLIPNVSQNIDNRLDNVVVSNVGIEKEVEVKTQETSSRPSRKRHFLLSETELEEKIHKKRFKNVNVNVAEQSASMNGDPKHLTDQISELDSDFEPTLVIAENVEVSHSNNDTIIEECARTSGDSACNNSLNGTSSEEEYESQVCSEENTYTKIPLPETVKMVFQATEKGKFSSAHNRRFMRNLVESLINPDNAKNCKELIYYLVSYLHVSRRNPMQSFKQGNNPELLFPVVENCFVTALFLICHKNKPHLTGLMESTVNTLHHLILLKTKYHIWGLSSLCRVLTNICKQLKDAKKIKLLCYDIFKHNLRSAPFLIATVVSIWPEVLAVSSDSTEEEVLFMRAIAYGCKQKPKTLTDTQWKNCNNILRLYFNVKPLHFDANTIIKHFVDKIISKSLHEPIEDDFLLKGPLIIYSRIEGWEWTLKFLLEKVVFRSLTIFCEEANEKGFEYLTDLIVDLCFVFEEKISEELLLRFVTPRKEIEFVYLYGGRALLKLISLKKEEFPSVMEQWIEEYSDDQRTNICLKYLHLRMIRNYELYLEDIFK
ncbi:uncharacterized protein NPIL_490551 [Nephila pilipes]|uniref:Uncharacterized protein n=1 Tax=Nephila pilipes TaxID=299642 RepID=A0A8X6MKH7_NEPPI|nr:uncharacterized protein NPIL_490551 [Nephila pilipes]